MSERWEYKVLEVKPKLFESSATNRLEEELNRLGRLGWEVATMHQASSLEAIRVILKKEH